MSKRTYYRRYRRTYPKQKWQLSVVNSNLEFNNTDFGGNTFYAKHAVICKTPVPVNEEGAGVVSANNIVKTGNFKVKGTIYIGNAVYGTYYDAIVYVIFVPQGITPDSERVSIYNIGTSLFFSHPEWVLGWTRIDLDQNGSDNFSITSRLKRNLNSGDSIQLGVLVTYRGTDQNNLIAAFRSTVQYSARAN